MLAIVDDNAKKQCVLILDTECSLGTGVEHLVSDEAGICVVGASSPDEATLLEIIKHLKPDVVILDETYFLTLTLGLLLQLLDYSQLRVLTVSTNDGRMQMYDKQQMRISRMGANAVDKRLDC